MTATRDRLRRVLPPAAIVPPHDSRAEESLIGLIVLDGERFWAVPLREEHFYVERHRRLFRAMTALAQRSETIDLVTVVAEMRRQGDDETHLTSELARMASDCAPTPMPVYRELEELRQRRMILQASAQLVPLAREGHRPVEEALSVVDGLVSSLAGAAADAVVDLRDVAKQRAEELCAGEGLLECVPTGLGPLDTALVGIPRGELTVVGGRPSMGKSAVAFQIATTVAARGEHVFLASAEMGKKGVADRAIASAAQVDLRRLRAGKLSDQEWGDVGLALQRIPSMAMTDMPSMTTQDIAVMARRLHQKRPLDLIVVDYLQFLSDDRGDDAVQAVGRMTRALRNLAKTLRCGMLVVSQLSRENERGGKVRRPMLSDLRGSGDIEQDADVVLLVHRPDYYDADDAPGEAEIIIAKQRNGPTGTEVFLWDRRTTRFIEQPKRKG